MHPQPNVIIFTDASSIGWGAFCATTGCKSAGGWSPIEKVNHINVLELLAIFMGLKTLCGEIQDKHIRVMCDNSTAVSYINEMGGTHSVECNKVAKTIWLWCIKKKIWLSSCFVPGKRNIKADTLSRKFNRNTEWMLEASKAH